MKKRLLSTLLALCLVLALLPAAASAGDAAPSAVELIHDATRSVQEWQVLRLVNQSRMAMNLQPLSVFDGLQMAANQRAHELISSYSHTRPDGSGSAAVYGDYGVVHTAAAENIAGNHETSAAVMDLWLDSPEDRANIYSAAMTHLGAGYRAGAHPTFWTLDFIGASCRFSGLRLSSDTIKGRPGASLETLLAAGDITVTANCSLHGSCSLPLIAAMCSGYDSASAAAQSLTVSYGGQTASLTVTGTAPGKPVDKDAAAPSGMPFTDVSADSWFYSGVEYVWTNKLMDGVSGTHFAPAETTSRAMVWTVLARMNGVSTAPASGTAWYEPGMLWAMKQGISDGSRAVGSVTREQLAVMLWRNAGSPDAPDGVTLAPFGDSGQVSGYALDAVRWAVGNGILGGSNGKLNPRGTASRAEVATLVMRYSEKTDIA